MPKITRRSFAARAVAAVAATAAVPELLAQVAPQTQATPPKTPALPPASQAEVDARVNWIFTKYGARLDDTQRADIRRIIASGQPAIDAMRAYPLTNADGPAGAFNPIVAHRVKAEKTTVHPRRARRRR